jgi:hypothetical protein
MGFTVALTLLLGFTMLAQEGWAELPGCPSLLRPLNGELIGPTLIFQWRELAASPPVTSYHLVVDNNNDFSTPEIDVILPSSPTEYRSSVALDPGLYNWKLQATNSEGEGPFSNARTFTIRDNEAPNTSLLSPANGAITNDQTRRFDWRDSFDTDGINRYTIQISTNSNFLPQ